MFFAGKMKLVCLLAGMLTLGEIGVHTVVYPQETAEDASTEETAAEKALDIAGPEEESDAQNDQMMMIYQKLEEEENAIRALLKEKEEELKSGGDVEQTEIMELNEELRSVQLQKMVMDARMEEKSFDK